MEELISKVLFTYGPFAIGWLVAAFFLWREVKGRNDEKGDNVITVKAYKEMVDAYRMDMQSTREVVACLQVKVDTLWDFMLRRAKSEAVQHGIATMNSPLIFTPRAKEMIAPLERKLREWYLTLDPKPEDTELAIEIERSFGDEILAQVCIPHGLYMGACLWIAIEAAKGTMAVSHDVNSEIANGNGEHKLIVEAASDRKELHDRLEAVEAEMTRQSGEQTRQSDEQTRQSDEQTRQSDRMDKAESGNDILSKKLATGYAR